MVATPKPVLLLLCSASPRRRELLSGMGLQFETVAPDVDESPRQGEEAAALAERLARLKLLAGLADFRARSGGESSLVALGSDTVVACKNEILGKPRDRADGLRMLALLSGAEHSVVTSVSVADPGGTIRSRTVETRVRLRALSPDQQRWLAASGDGDDKAGGYAVQGLAGAFVERIEGSVTNVVGLPLAEAIDLLVWAGARMPWDPA